MTSGHDPIALFPPISDPSEPAYAVPEHRAGRPRVLLLGDSISIGYTLPVRAALADTATVFRPAANCGQTAYALQHLEGWLGTEPWRVIHFNFGLHDLKFLDPAGNYVPPDQGRQVTPLDAYRRNLTAIVTRLAATGASLIFATTTPVPPGSAGRPAGSEVPYNQCAREIMTAHGIALNDLWALASRNPSGFLCPNDVHFTPEGKRALAAQVSASIRAALAGAGV